MDTPEGPRPDLSQLPPPAHPGTPPPPPPLAEGPPPGAAEPAGPAGPGGAARRKGPRLWVWIVVIAALLVGGGATAFVLVTQANQAAAHEAALGAHAEAIAAYESAWDEFERQNGETRDDQGILSMTSLDNAEEVVASFVASIEAADALERTEFSAPSAEATDAEISADTERVAQAAGEVEQVTQQLAATSKLFLDSHRSVESANLTNQAAAAEETLAAVRDRADAALVAELEQAILDARALAEDPSAHPTELRKTMEALVTLTGQVRDSAGPTAADVDGTWAATDVVIPTGGHTGLTASNGQIGQDESSFGEALAGETNIVFTDPLWVEQDGCLKASVGQVGRHSQLWYCPAGVAMPAEAQGGVFTLRPNQSAAQVEDTTQDRLIGNWILYRR